MVEKVITKQDRFVTAPGKQVDPLASNFRKPLERLFRSVERYAIDARPGIRYATPANRGVLQVPLDARSENLRKTDLDAVRCLRSSRLPATWNSRGKK